MNKKYAFLLMLLLPLLGACSSEDSTLRESTSRLRRMVFDGQVVGFVPATRAASVSVPQGAVMYLQLGSVTTTASFDGGEWTVTLPDNLSDNASGTCTAYYFPSASVSGSQVSLSSSRPLFKGTGTFSNSQEALKLVATLRPMTMRLHFRGTPGARISVSGIEAYNSFDASSHKLTSGALSASLTVQQDGYTPYVHGMLASDRTLRVSDGTYTYTRTFSSSVMREGESGWLDIPTPTSHVGWTTDEQSDVDLSGGDYGGETDWNQPDKEPTTDVDFSGGDYDGENDWNQADQPSTRSFTVNGVSFTMVLVEAGTFTMGATAEQEDPDNDEKPAHQVTLTKDYYMGETEVTQGLWEAVMGQKPTSGGKQWLSTYGLGASYPAYFISWDDVQSFLTKLNSLTGQTFRMPTEAEWEYAARGGKKSQGYQYSGSNTIGNVAWYAVNSYDMGSSSPDYGTHAVKTKQANELGLYDMSCNVWEWCSDWYSSSYYTSSAVTNPTGPTSGSNRVLRGGSWVDNAGDCRVADRGGSSPSDRYSNFGFRLALSSSDVQSESSDGHTYVDLGLSVKWATCSVGASSAEEYGDYYAWGETETKTTYNWSTYKWCNGSSTTMTKYCTSSSFGTVDNKTTLEPSDDVAHVKWGGNWRMPTDDEFTELRNTSNCTWTWTTQGGKNGYKVTSKKNGNSIFLPAAGYRYDGILDDAGSYYWSSSLGASNSNSAYVLDFDSGNVSGYRFCGLSVRPVCP